jgi:hypothetical protein
MTQENPESMGQDARRSHTLFPAGTGAIVIRDFKREEQMAATRVSRTRFRDRRDD